MAREPLGDYASGNGGIAMPRNCHATKRLTRLRSRACMPCATFIHHQAHGTLSKDDAAELYACAPTAASVLLGRFGYPQRLRGGDPADDLMPDLLRGQPSLVEDLSATAMVEEPLRDTDRADRDVNAFLT